MNDGFKKFIAAGSHDERSSRRGPLSGESSSLRVRQQHVINLNRARCSQQRGFPAIPLEKYAREHRLWRTELATNDVSDYGHLKSVEQLPALRRTLQGITENYLNLQQDIRGTFVDRGQWQQLRQATLQPSGRRSHDTARKYSAVGGMTSQAAKLKDGGLRCCCAARVCHRSGCAARTAGLRYRLDPRHRLVDN